MSKSLQGSTCISSYICSYNSSCVVKYNNVLKDVDCIVKYNGVYKYVGVVNYISNDMLVHKNIWP